MPYNRRFILLALLLCLVLSAVPAFAQSNRINLNNNFGSGNEIWSIQGEPSLVMNGFDLTPTSLTLPVIIENVSIDIYIANALDVAEAVVYADANGGSPQDATLIASTQLVFTGQGRFTATFPTPVITDSPIVWIGFYMPVGTQFLSDRQGRSVLTYWAWTPDALFDLRRLSNAQILGPSDGSAPVNLNIGGVARITATARSANGVVVDNFYRQFDQTATDDLSYLINYAGCPGLFKDEGDLRYPYNGSISPGCIEVESWNAPRSPTGFFRKSNSRGSVFDVAFYNERGLTYPNEIPYPVTHCIPADSADLDTAVMGVAWGVPRQWELLPTQRFRNLICAELPRGGGISYFVPVS
ncbi:MAG: hypothetical protein ACOYL5_17675 [Phototrophicaceae bacterium]|jgi:hypothetical protein